MCSDIKGDIIQQVTNKTARYNSDNITRTKAYQNFYLKNREIRWAFLASMVSRNAGWNMTDLAISPLKTLLTDKQRGMLFSTYERANWLIFSDVYPQLLLYQLSKERKTPLFHHLDKFHVSQFMINEWIRFWETKDKSRLVKALIINEQNVIENPVIQQPWYQHKVFHQWPYMLESIFRLNVVLLPGRSGRLYGLPVYRFTHLDQRIAIGNTLTEMLFHPDYYPDFHDFALNVEPTGSRKDYEQFFYDSMASAPPLQQIYSIVQHQDNIREDWFRLRGLKQKWWQIRLPLPDDAPRRYYVKKQALMQLSKWMSSTGGRG
ncbi:DUF2515 family protein [Thalassobacillus sp. B23F22_16]|uniref:DUF2515 family protein n=1 Tax=Thalassobacillus sp. B23F22_16 TaxID=3459513 RepID=UPI00373E7ED0